MVFLGNKNAVQSGYIWKQRDCENGGFRKRRRILVTYDIVKQMLCMLSALTALLRINVSLYMLHIASLQRTQNVLCLVNGFVQRRKQADVTQVKAPYICAHMQDTNESIFSLFHLDESKWSKPEVVTEDLFHHELFFPFLIDFVQACSRQCKE